MTSWLLSFETTTTPKLNLEHNELSFESKRKKKNPLEQSHKTNDSNEIEFQLVLLLPRTTVKWPSKSLVTARYFFGPR